MKNNNKKLGILLFNGPESQDIRTVVGLASAAIQSEIEVELFLMYEGVLNASYKPLQELSKNERCKVIVCNHNTGELMAAKCENFKYGSQFDNAYILNESDRYIAFI